ncbi:3'-5' exonuclease [Roseicella aquatilis]|uniref:3'-5' exonuclease n=1 Tax=Roseicella aquatilis TaxID=2527868 RepID=A0A4R4DV41_9PROT|nr:3'-5' exonuclease [Roseicella aquatilis]TCZ66153.1 3'-5' exonuclease [Roseicella aquatilis]
MWNGGPITVFDTETTGAATGDRVVSLGAVRLDAALEPEATLHLAFAPGIPCHWGAARVHGMSDAFLARHPPFETHAAEVTAFFGGLAAAAHNMPFDRRMLGGEFARLGLPLPWGEAHCTLQLWRRAHPGQRAGLAHAAAACGLGREGALHGALEDAWLAAQLLRALHGLPPAPMRLHGITNSPAGADMAA